MMNVPIVQDVNGNVMQMQPNMMFDNNMVMMQNMPMQQLKKN